MCFFFSSRRRHTRWTGDWSSDVCSSDLFWQLRMKKRTSNRLVLATTHEETDKARTLRTKHGPLGCRAGIALARGRYRRVLNDGQIGRASCGKECRSRCAPKHEI